MKRIIRSIVWVDSNEKATAVETYKTVAVDRLVSLTATETEILEHCIEFFSRTSEAPQFDLVYDHFKQAADAEAVTFLEDCIGNKPFSGASFSDLFETIVESQASNRLVSLCKTAIKISTQGEKIGNSTIKGHDEAVTHLFSSLENKPSIDNNPIKPNMRENITSLTDLYMERKNNPQNTYGIKTGYELIDESTAGIRKSQFYLCAGFGGHLKSTLMLNKILNAAVDGKWNPLLFSSEMPVPELQLMLISMHSANPKFSKQGKPLSSFKLLLGNLEKAEEDFFEYIKGDLLTNKDYGQIRMIDTSQFSTLGSCLQRTVREHMELPVDILWIDYITRLPLDSKYARTETIMARNESLADAKRFAMAFNQGEGLPVCSPFQIYREGYKSGLANSGKLLKTALAQYNSAEKEADIISYIWYDEEEKATYEPKLGLMKSRWGEESLDPVPVYIEPDSRRIMDLASGLMPVSPTATTGSAEEEVDIDDV